jgi:hypothetical protein
VSIVLRLDCRNSRQASPNITTFPIMTNSITSVPFLQREPSWHANVDDVDSTRGRTRVRNLSRSNVSKSINPEESSTLRGRSRRRAASPSGLGSRNASPSLGSILYYKLKESSRREHCPSRPASSSSTRRQNSPRRRQQRTRSTSRNAARAVVEAKVAEMQLQQQSSSLRNEVLREDPLGQSLTAGELQT